MGRKYTELLKDVKEIKLPKEYEGNNQNIYWVYGIVLGDEIKCDNREFVKKLGEKGVGSRTFFWCMHEQPVYTERGLFKNEKYPVAEKLARKGLYIPSGLALTDEQINRGSDVVKHLIAELI